MLPTPERLTLTRCCTPDTKTVPVPLFSTFALPRLPRHTMLPVLRACIRRVHSSVWQGGLLAQGCTKCYMPIPLLASGHRICTGIVLI